MQIVKVWWVKTHLTLALSFRGSEATEKSFRSNEISRRFADSK